MVHFSESNACFALSCGLDRFDTVALALLVDDDDGVGSEPTGFFKLLAFDFGGGTFPTGSVCGHRGVV